MENRKEIRATIEKSVSKKLELYFKMLDIVKALKLDNMFNGGITVRLSHIENNLNAIIEATSFNKPILKEVIIKDEQTQN